MRLKVFLVAGARPNFMKIAPIYYEMQARSDSFEPLIVHTGQHYDENMSKVFFEDLELPRPDIYLDVGSGTHAEQTAEIMKRFEPKITEYQPHLVLVVGDVNSTIACALTAAKTRIPSEELGQLWRRYETYLSGRSDLGEAKIVAPARQNAHDVPLIAHVEAGERSFDWSMPEEINRVGTDVFSNMLFTTGKDADEHLLAEGVDARRIFRVGNVMIDSLERLRQKATTSKILDRINARHTNRLASPVGKEGFGLVTLHRAGNVDDSGTLAMILSALVRVSERIPLIFPVHPRTRKLIAKLDNGLQSRLSESRVLLSEPMSYLDFLHLQMNALLVLTDSGGVQVETSYLGVPCLTLRPNTEWRITLREGTNQLVALDEEAIVLAAETTLKNEMPGSSEIDKWDGRTGRRIVEVLQKLVER